MPSPQISVQTELDGGVLLQVNPASTVHVELHPSPLFRLPSSHRLELTTCVIPSPHIGVHVSLVVNEPPLQIYPASTAQVQLQPSPEIKLPSSQYDTLELLDIPFPHITLQVSKVVSDPPVQV